jgi:hypothetical protein
VPALSPAKSCHGEPTSRFSRPAGYADAGRDERIRLRRDRRQPAQEAAAAAVPAIIPTWLLFIVLGNTSSGGAVAQPLLPPFYAFVGRFLPPGATVSIIRTAVYFRHDQHAEPFIVQGAWLVCVLAALLISVRKLGREPACRNV